MKCWIRSHAHRKIITSGIKLNVAVGFGCILYFGSKDVKELNLRRLKRFGCFELQVYDIRYGLNDFTFLQTKTVDILYNLYIGVEILQLIYMEEAWSYFASSCLNPAWVENLTERFLPLYLSLWIMDSKFRVALERRKVMLILGSLTVRICYMP